MMERNAPRKEGVQDEPRETAEQKRAPVVSPAAMPGLVWLDPATPIRDCDDRDCGAPDHLV